jgi:hypothetical protein
VLLQLVDPFLVAREALGVLPFLRNDLLEPVPLGDAHARRGRERRAWVEGT